MEKQTKAKKSAPASKSGGTATKSKSAPKKSATPATSGGQDSSMLQEFILDSLKDIYWAEKHLTKALPKLLKAATSDELKQAFQEGLKTFADLEKNKDKLGKDLLLALKRLSLLSKYL